MTGDVQYLKFVTLNSWKILSRFKNTDLVDDYLIFTPRESGMRERSLKINVKNTKMTLDPQSKQQLDDCSPQILLIGEIDVFFELHSIIKKMERSRKVESHVLLVKL